MKERILQAIIDGWNLPVFEYTKMRDYSKRIVTIYNLLDVFELNENDTVMLYGRNSQNWIAIYIACLLKGVRLLIVSPNMSGLEVVHAMLLTNTNHIFIDDDLVYSDLGKNVLLRTLISTDTLEVIFEKGDKTYFKVLAEVIVSSEKSLHVDLRTIQSLFEKKLIESSVITATSGTEHGSPKWVESDTGSIADLLTKAIPMMPMGTNDKVFSNVEFAESHYLTVLLPFVHGCVFVGRLQDAEIVFEDTSSMEDTWKRSINYLYGNKLISLVLPVTWLKWLSAKIVVHNLKKHYGKKLKSLVIYNSVVSEDIISILVGKMPIYTTYGSQETNQLVAINDFSNEQKRLPGAVGTALPGLVLHTHNDELEISGTTLFKNYVGDEEYTKEVRFRDNYITGDNGVTDPKSKVVFVYGRMSAIAINEFKLPIQLDKLERIIKSIPYIKDALIVIREGKLVLLVYPDILFTELKGLGILHLEKLFDVYLHQINLELNESSRIDRLVVVTRPLRKTHDNKVCRHFYS